MKSVNWLNALFMWSTVFTINAIMGIYGLMETPFSANVFVVFIIHIVGFLFQFTIFTWSIEKLYKNKG